MRENITHACTVPLLLFLFKSLNSKSRHLPLQIVGINSDDKGKGNPDHGWVCSTVQKGL
jgi:hypothetical protein